VETHDPSLPTVQLGTDLEGMGFNVRVFFNGWNGGVVPTQDFEETMEHGAELAA
jgi:hypothetical protein